MKQLALTVIFLTAACKTPVDPGTDAAPEPRIEAQEVARGAAGELGKLDVLFVIDNSGSMKDEQEALAAEMPTFLDTLRGEDDDLPDLHVGVITSDMGAGNFGIENCSGNGDGGQLQTTVDDGCPLIGPKPYIIDRPGGTTGRTGNYEGPLDEAMACLSLRGLRGCGFEQPLKALKWALDDNDFNNGFLRDDADLAVVFLTDEDDCSVHDSGIFDPAQDDIGSDLGNLTSFRCFEFGVVCEPDDPRDAGEKSDCTARVDSPYVADVKKYVDFLGDLKGERRVAVSLIAGDVGPIEVTVEANASSGQMEAFLEPSCVGDAGEASPPIRLAAFADAFALRSSASICEEGYPIALGEVADDLRAATLCLDGDLADSDPAQDGVQPNCSVDQIGPDGTVAALPSCADSSARPCFDLVLDQGCGGGHLADVRRNALPPAGTEVAVTCDVVVQP